MKKLFKTLAALLVLLLIAGAVFLYWPLYERSVPPADNEQPVDAVLIGGGIMSVTLATYLQELEPDWQVRLFERLDDVALESSNGWNNAGTGHSGFAELNYTPELPDGSIETARAVAIAEQFEVSRQFWAHQVQQGRLQAPGDFINPTPHMSFVWGDENIEYLRKRHAALIQNPLFHGMQFSEDPEQIRAWAPLMIEGRDAGQKIAATYMPLGTDVNFGVITRQLTAALQRHPNFQMQLQYEVRALRQNDDRTWNVTVRDLRSGQERTIKSRFVFIGAGGASLKLLQLSGIPEAQNYAGFPVGGQFLAFEAPGITGRHDVKAYGKAEAGSPPMSVPHLDARRLDGKPVVLFGPFALYSTKFLKEGSWFDLFSSVNNHNVLGMLTVGSHNLDLVRYLMQQAMLSDEDRHAELIKYFPAAKREDWRLVTAGQRVQVIKKDPQKGTVLQFGTEIVTDEAGTIAALLGASPGASTSPPIMLSVLKKAFPQQMAQGWEEQLKRIIPSYGRQLNDSPALTNEIRSLTSQALQLPYLEVPTAPVDPEPLPAEPQPAPTPEPAPEPERHLNSELQAL
ncbi:malate dehydrogenase (quinone) [Corticibacter populi]|uniref:Probable malate:quinone oxidoreductase n=1 Tax=Corticibacter populi TaxID=1550736 RepID=A0A3M6QXR9_9BURK|nr:malate dehydrogenase (quinone) [Corticibacter populi]RMX07826.1 malate dehydrogenase (quinone) [Corticibacter populi]RZS35060.1 malate dehydrogenase (quinone) [Corticibacter populi]